MRRRRRIHYPRNGGCISLYTSDKLTPKRRWILVFSTLRLFDSPKRSSELRAAQLGRADSEPGYRQFRSSPLVLK